MRRRGVPIALVIVTGISLVAVTAVALVLFAGYDIARRNTAELMRERAELITSSIVEQVRGHLDPAQALLEYLADVMVRQNVDTSDRQRLGELLSVSLAAAPQVAAVSFIDRQLHALQAFRNRPGKPVAWNDWSDDPRAQRDMQVDQFAFGAYWSELIFAEDLGNTLITVRLPVRRPEGFIGSLVAVVSIQELSDRLLDVGGDYVYNAFVLYDRDHVLAHPMMMDGYPGLSEQRPLPRLIEFTDPVLSEIWSPRRNRGIEASITGKVASRVVDFAGNTYVFLFRDLKGYGDRPWIVGTYLHFEDVGAQIDRLGIVPRLGLVVIVAALLIAVVLGRALSRPVRQLAQVATQVRELNFHNLRSLPTGLFREMNEAAAAFNAMIGGLQWFMTYVPRSLVLRLIREGQERAIPSEERQITVMFTDIAGFTSLAEDMPAAEVAELLNAHFAVVGACIEAEDGTIDKYIGDALMAFWGAPEAQHDHGLRACRAALEISRRVSADNARRTASGLRPIGVRIGIHSGPAVVGNIGAPGRVNYTVIGDTVNIAERLEALAREFVEEGAKVSILVSDETARLAAGEIEAVSVGAHSLRGRHEKIEVFQLIS